MGAGKNGEFVQILASFLPSLFPGQILDLPVTVKIRELPPSLDGRVPIVLHFRIFCATSCVSYIFAHFCHTFGMMV